MDIIVATAEHKQLGFMNGEKTVDLEIGDNNDFEITIPLQDFIYNDLDFDRIIFVPDTEYGGMVKDIQTITSTDEVKVRGYTWRGMLERKIIEPPQGQAYLVIEDMELNTAIKRTIGNMFSGSFNLFSISDSDTGVKVTYQFDRYTTLLSGLTKMLEKVGHRLNIKYIMKKPCYIELSAVPISDYSEQHEYSQDYNIDFSVRDCRTGINHLICLGKGELTNRLVVHLYAWPDGTVKKTRYYEGQDERVAIYDYSSADDETTLIENGTERLKDLMNYKTVDVDIDNIDIDIGDIVGGRDRITGITVKKPIETKILKITETENKISYKVKGEN